MRSFGPGARSPHNSGRYRARVSTRTTAASGLVGLWGILLTISMRKPGRRPWGRAAWLLATVVLYGCGVSSLSTDVPIQFHGILKGKYEGKTAWTRLTVEDEKKAVKIEQDEEVHVISHGRKRVVYPFRLARPLTLEHYERALLDALWFDDPDQRYAKNKEQYGTRMADAVRDHKILNDMSMYVAYLAWGAPSKVIPIKRGSDERWEYATPNLKNASIDFRGGRVEHFNGENVADTEAATERKRTRRGP